MTPKYRYRQLLLTTSVLLSALFIAIAHDCAAGPAPTPYTLGVFPHLSSGQIEKLFAPLAAHLSQELGRSVRLRTKPNFTDFTAELSRQTYDVAFVQPFDYVAAHDKYGYMPLARRAGALAAILVVLPDSPLHTLQDLKGKRVGLPPRVAAISFLTRKALSDAGMNIEKDVTLEYFKAHDACLNQLMLHKVDVCGSAEHPIRFYENKWNVTFRTLATTKTIPPALFMAHRRIPAKAREAIKRALLSWQKTKQGRDMLQGNGFTLFQSTDDAEYAVMRKYVQK
jgi:phosphonate transport system substrate-binding protein